MTAGEELFEEGHGPVTPLLTSDCLHWIDGVRALGRQKTRSESDNCHTSYLSIPFGAWKSDYAILARMDDSTTGVPVLIEAGLGNDGSLAANELITSGALAAKLANESPCSGKSNFEAVVGTDLIDTKPGPPHILRLSCW
jgi:hypothetical protein